ncbi:MAG: M14 family zinc carboxypeptidase [bacterium]
MSKVFPLTSIKSFLGLLTLFLSYVLLTALSGKKPESKRRNPSLPPSYKPLDNIQNDIFDLQFQYPDLIHVEKIGSSTTMAEPILAIKISDNVSQREDEPRILFAGVHHAREPIGANICLELARTLCRKYRRDPEITRWVDSIEIWLVPVVNPDGYKYIFDNDLRFPWWRKNLRDNDGDGVFDPLYDGVDLNRNYDYNWQEGGDGKPNSWFYRGSSPFSEKETQAIMNLARRENFVMGISYHSYGKSILFPWGNFNRPPDLELIVDIASGLASKINRVSGRGNYSILPLNGRVGQSSIWMYAEQGVIDFIVEVGTQYFPPEGNVPSIIHENLEGAFYLFDRMLETGIKGHVYDFYTKEPLLAEVKVRELSARYVRPRMTDKEFGSFYRLLLPGSFTVEIQSKGYFSKVLKNVRVRPEKPTEFDVGLIPNRELTN